MRRSRVSRVPTPSPPCLALDATLNIALDADDTHVSFTNHHTDAA
ncbi:hypothetical protein ACIO14_23485 [Nocardia fluminea]